jgi:alpha-amylase/alpha-mannosidase (GH57 family)
MIEPNARYAELLARRDSNASFSVDDLRDLQVWHKVVWLDAYYLDADPRVAALVAKGRGFSEDDKRALREVELEILGKVIPEYRDAAARGQAELSTSPFYHPILPLLCDTDVYLRTHPQSRMPRERFRRPEDADEQLRRAVALHARLFGQPPAGVWPSEGSVSDAMVPLVANAGMAWMATDEEILARTLGDTFARDAAIYRPYRVGGEGAGVACGFRDHELSDLIGFAYASWNAADAARDFTERLVAAGARYRAAGGRGEPTVFVILDGENAWEHYEGQGRPFLRAFYGSLEAHRELQTVTMAEACVGASERLPSIFPGSWINGDFYIWIGHPDDHRAWGQLAEARRALDSPPPGLPEGALEQAREELLIAEGSDWFWWYGDDHSSDHDLEFDDLFRRHVRNVYRALGLPIPEELHVTNITTKGTPVQVDRPTGFIRPTVDGEPTSYFEWIGAGCVEVSSLAGAMHQVAARPAAISVIEFGFDLEFLYVRVDATQSMADLLAGGLTVSLNIYKPAGHRIMVSGGDGQVAAELRTRHDGSWAPQPCEGLAAAAGSILEVAVPFGGLGLSTGETLAFFVGLNGPGGELEHHPRHRPIEVTVPDPQFGSVSWTA